MGVRLNPCFGCPLQEGCDLRPEWRKRVSGLGLRSATFDCPRLAKQLRPGRRIEIAVPFEKWTDGHFDGPQLEIFKAPVSATITYVCRSHHFVCTVDPHPDIADKYRFRRRLRHSRIKRFLEEPDARICPALSHVVREGRCDRPPNQLATVAVCYPHGDWEP